MLLKLSLNEEWYKRQIEYNNTDKDCVHLCESSKLQLSESNEVYGFSFLTCFLAMYLQTALRTESPQPFNEISSEDRFEIEDYGYAESEDEIIAYLQNTYGSENPDTFVAEVILIVDYDKLYKHGTFIKNGVDTEENYHCWFNEHGGKPECQYGEDDGNYVFVHVTIWRKTQ